MACWNKSDCFNFLKLFRHKEKEVSEVSADWSFECWWNLSEKCQNRWWTLGVRPRCWNKSSLVALDGKIVAMTKRSTSDRSNVKVMLILFCIVRVSFIMSLFPVVRQSIKSSIQTSWSIWERQCKGRGLRCGQTTPGCWTMTMHLLTQHFLSVNFWQSMRRLLFPNHPTLQICPLRSFSSSRR